MDEDKLKSDFVFVNVGMPTIKTETEDDEYVKTDNIKVEDEDLIINDDHRRISGLKDGDESDLDEEDWAPLNCEVQIDEADTNLTFRKENENDLQTTCNNDSGPVSASQDFVTPRFEGLFELVEIAGSNYWNNDMPGVKIRPPNRKNTSQGRFLCGFCPYKAADTYRLTIHLRTHSGDKPFKCTLCNYESTQKSALNVHMKRHLGLSRAYVCGLCGQRYATRRSHDLHVLKHSGVVPEPAFKCEDCSYCTASAYHLTLHRRTHTGEKPYACDKCPYRFATPTNLKAHARIHNGMQISCPHCVYRCVQPRDLKRHLRKHTGDLFGCAVCDYRAPSRNEIRLHMRKHKEKVEEKSEVKKKLLRSTLGRSRRRKEKN